MQIHPMNCVPVAALREGNDTLRNVAFLRPPGQIRPDGGSLRENRSSLLPLNHSHVCQMDVFFPVENTNEKEVGKTAAEFFKINTLTYNTRPQDTIESSVVT